MKSHWRAVLEHPILRLELQRVRRKRWWPGRRFFLFYPVLLGGALGCGVMLALTDSLGVQVAAAVTGGPVICLVSAVTGLLSLALSWIAPALTATTIARERELGTFDLLRTTLLTERSIVLGKLGGCVVKLWPAILALVLLCPFQLVWMVGSGVTGLGSLGGLYYLPMFMIDYTSTPSISGRLLVALLITVVAGLLRPWGDMALHTVMGLFVSTLARSSGVAVAIAYGAIIAVRAGLWLATSLVSPLVMVSLGVLAEAMVMTSPEYVLLVPGLVSLAMPVIEIVGAALLVWGAIWWLKRT
jgi:hypothetical protein